MLLLLDAAALLAFALVVLWARHRSWHMTAEDVRKFFALWAAIALFEYYCFGPYSFIQMDEAGEMYVTVFIYLNSRFLGGEFAHHLGSGVDITTYQTGSQLFSADVFLFGLLPVWIAILTHKLIVLMVAVCGTYVLCRRSVGADRATAAFVAAFFSISTEYMNQLTFGWGAAHAFLPWLIYAMVVRAGRAAYFFYALPPMIGCVIFASPTNWVLPNFAGIALAALLFNRLTWQVVAATLLFLLLLIVTWGDVFYAMSVTAPYTERGGVFAPDKSLTAILRDGWSFLWNDRVLFVGLAVLVLLWLRRDPLRLRAALALTGPFLFYLFLLLFPWGTLGLKFIQQVSLHHVLVAGTALYLPLLAKVTAPLPDAHRDRFRLPVSTTLALAVCVLVYYKGINLINFIYHGGQSAYFTVDSATRADWRPNEPFRVITLRAPDIGPEPELAVGFYDLSAYDFYLSLKPVQHSQFWSLGVLGGVHDQRVYVDWSKWDGERYRIAEHLPLNLLRLANIGAILSPVPLDGPGLVQVAGPAVPPVTRDRIRREPWNFLLERVRRIFDFNDPYVYRLDRFVPLAYGAGRLSTVSSLEPTADFIKTLSSLSDAAGSPIVVSTSDAQRLGAAQATLRVMGVDEVRNGYRVHVDAPDGGILVLNTPWMPFWQVTASGQTLTPVSANFIHQAVPVPPGSRTVLFQYRRPGMPALNDRSREWLGWSRD
jgi:hypothetical protein